MANEDKATRYHRLRRRASIARVGLAALFLFALVASGASAALRDALTAALAGASAPILVAYATVLVAGHLLIQAPPAYYQGVILERRYGCPTIRRGAGGSPT